MNNIAKIAAAGCVALLASCAGNQDKWTVKGSIDGLKADDTVLLEGSNQGGWYLIDTIRPADDGSFTYSHAPQGYPDIYRVRVGDQSVYFPIDSIETVTLTATAPAISSTHTLTGTPQAENLARADSILLAAASQPGGFGDQALKRRLGQMILAEPDGVVAYYIISKSIAGKPVFNPADKFDNRIIGAVANAFVNNRPADPRTGYLRRLFLENRQRTLTGTQMEAKVIGAFDIELFDQKGRKQRLLDLAGQGKTVLLSFTSYTQDWSPSFNVELNRVYQKYHPMGLEIYQVAVDGDEYAWKQAANNLPWITVLNNVADPAPLRNYNVTVVPTTFVIDRNGELVERVLSIEDLDAAIAKHI